MSSPLTSSELRRAVDGVDWFHSIDLGYGIVTSGRSDTRAQLRTIGLPADLRGRTVLDIGAWDGFYSFEAERRGASRVLATDSFAWSGEGRRSKAGFQLAREALGSRVEDMDIDVLDLSAERPGSFDLVLFLGVLYHMRDPLLALEKVAAVTARELILETHVDLLGVRRPAAAFYPGTELSSDHTNWWGPNPAAVIGMLRAVGFDEIRVVWPRSRAHGAARSLYRAGRALREVPAHGTFALRGVRQGRLVVHAFK